MTETNALTKQRIIAELTRSPHGKLNEYLPVGRQAVAQDQEFFAHLIAWNNRRGEVKDAKKALPVLGLGSTHSQFLENAAAHLADLDVREFTKLVTDRPFIKEALGTYQPRALRRLVERYLRNLENDKYRLQPVMLQHRKMLHTLYSVYRISPAEFVKRIIFLDEAPAGSVFEVVRRLGTMTPTEAAGAIVERKIPFLIAQGALQGKLKDPDIMMALIKRMSPNELVTNMKRFEKLGVREHPALRATLDEALEKAGTSKKGKATLKTSRAVAAVTDESLKLKLKRLQETQLDKMTIKGDWLVLADKSGSMHTAIETARQIAAILARLGEGKVHLVFFDEAPRAFDVTGKSLEEIVQVTQHVTASGGTSVSCGLSWAIANGLNIDGIAVISDGGENRSPTFGSVYAAYCRKIDKVIPVYFYELEGEPDRFTGFCAPHDIGITRFDLRRQKIDYYSLPNLVQTMRTNTYSLVDEIYESKLKTLDEVLDKTVGMHVFAREAAHA